VETIDYSEGVTTGMVGLDCWHHCRVEAVCLAPVVECNKTTIWVLSETVDMETVDMEAVHMEAVHMETVDMETVDMEVVDMEVVDMEVVDMEVVDMEVVECLAKTALTDN